jgi:hypothetical protein
VRLRMLTHVEGASETANQFLGLSVRLASQEVLTQKLSEQILALQVRDTAYVICTAFVCGTKLKASQSEACVRPP